MQQWKFELVKFRFLGCVLCEEQPPYEYQLAMNNNIWLWISIHLLDKTHKWNATRSCIKAVHLDLVTGLHTSTSSSYKWNFWKALQVFCGLNTKGKLTAPVMWSNSTEGSFSTLPMWQGRSLQYVPQSQVQLFILTCLGKGRVTTSLPCITGSNDKLCI